MSYEKILKEYEEKNKPEVVQVLKGLLSGEMENGMHAHVLDREEERSKKDGVHRHLFILPNGQFYVTAMDGEHWHTIPNDSDHASSDTSEHIHQITLPDNDQTFTMKDGYHMHQLMMETSAFDGGHTHWVSLPTGEIIRSETASSLIRRFGVPPTPPTQFGGSSNIMKRAKDYLANIFKPETKVIKECKDLSPDKIMALMALGYEIDSKTIVEKAAHKAKKKGKVNKNPQPKEIQTLIFPKGKFSKEQVQKFLKDGSFKSSTIEETGTAFRVAQNKEESFVSNSFRTVDLDVQKGVRAVVGKIRKEDDKDFDKLVECKILKADEAKHLVYSVVLEPEALDDTQGDIMSSEEIEKSAHFFLKNSQTIGLGHVKKIDAKVVESYIAPIEFEQNGQVIKKGSWVMAVFIEDSEVWEKVEKGELEAFSVGGYGERTPVS